MRSFERNMKAISPVLAVLMMIAVTIAGSLITYAWVTGYIGFTTEKAGKAIMIQSMAYDNETTTLYVYVQNVGEGAVELDEQSCLYINDGLQPCTVNLANGVVPEKATATINVTYTVSIGQKITAKVTTKLGTFTEKSDYPASTTGGVVTPPTPPPTVTRVLYTEDGFSGVLPGDLLVVIANTRTGTYVTGGITASATGYDTIETASYHDADPDNMGDRRAVTILTKTAVGTESGSVSVFFTGSGVATYETHYQVFRMTNGTNTWTPIANGANDGTASAVGSLPASSTTLPDGSTANVLSIGAMVSRNSPGTVSFSGLTGLDPFDDGGAYSATAYNYGLPITTSTVTLSTSQMASALLVQFACS